LLSAHALAFAASAQLVYTDGSQLKDNDDGACGCGVYAPPLASLLAAGIGPQRVAFRFAGDQTVMRAELMAIDYALEHVASNDLIIATDSLSSLQALLKTTRRPHLTARHRHARLLQSIVARLKARDDASQHTMLVKVRAHSSINGNEEADKLAKAAANDECTISEVASPTEHTTMFNGQTADSKTKLADTAALLNVARAARIARITADAPSTPAAKWAKSSVTDALLPDYSSKFRSARTVPRKVKRTILQLRCGRWIANGLLHKWKLAPSGR
jgi:ribonuclease HI